MRSQRLAEKQARRQAKKIIAAKYFLENAALRGPEKWPKPFNIDAQLLWTTLWTKLLKRRQSHSRCGLRHNAQIIGRPATRPMHPNNYAMYLVATCAYYTGAGGLFVINIEVQALACRRALCCSSVSVGAPCFTHSAQPAPQSRMNSLASSSAQLSSTTVAANAVRTESDQRQWGLMANTRALAVTIG